MLGRILRASLALIPRNAEIRILRGPLRGRKWVAGAASNAYWAGTYEAALLRTFADAIPPGATVYDIGANVGIFSLLAATKTGDGGQVYAFEPVPRNLHYLRRHLELNRVANCTVVDSAVSDSGGSKHFAAANWDHSMGRISADGELTVSSVTLDECIFGPMSFRPPDVIKVDVEGAEREVLRGGERAITQFLPTMFIEVHGTEHHADCKSFLMARGYNVQESYGRLSAAHPG